MRKLLNPLIGTEAQREMSKAMKNFEKKGIDRTKVVFRPKEGRAWNPLSGYPRNEPCWCGSGKKFKKCCLNEQGRTIGTDKAKRMAELVKEAQAERKCKKSGHQKTS